MLVNNNNNHEQNGSIVYDRINQLDTSMTIVDCCGGGLGTSNFHKAQII